MKTFNLKALTIALGLTVFSVAAHAASSPLTFVDGEAIFGDSFSVTEGGVFTDTFTFSLATNSTGIFSANVTSGYFTFGQGAVWGVDVTGFSLSGPVSAAGVETLTPIVFPIYYSDVWNISTTDLVAGSYTLTVTGNALPVTDFAGADVSYGGKAFLEVSAVPEPETYGMMLAGLGLMGFVAARRKSA